MFVYELSGCGFESSCSHVNGNNIKENLKTLFGFIGKDIRTVVLESIQMVEQT